MRFYIVLLALSMCAWVALAAVSGVGNAHMNQIGGQSAKVQAVDDAGAATTDDTAAATEPSASTTATEPAIPDAIANGGQPLPSPAGPRTPAEEKADSVLSCMEGCGGMVSCQNGCISTGYNIPSGPVPSVTASIPPPLATVTPGVSASTAPASATTAPGTPPKGQGSGAQSGFGYSMGGAVAFVVFASFFVAL